MRVTSLQAARYRNLLDIALRPGEGVNIIYGENAQGKTNLLECIWMFTGCRSFRGARDRELVQFEQDAAQVRLGFFADGRMQEASLQIDDRRHAMLNGVALSSSARLVGEFTAVVFSPLHLNLIKGGPAQRRRFLDTALCQLKPRYAGLLSQYNRTLAQRNILLKDISRHSELYDTLDIWEERLASLGASLIQERRQYLDGLCEVCCDIYAGLSQGREKLAVSYLQPYLKEKGEAVREETLFSAIRSARRIDIQNGTTSVGPHRDDLDITIGEISARSFGSQGQQRSAALALKLSEATMLQKITGERPVALLDDVMSELDAGRQDYILNHIDGWQVFITCCEPSPLLRLTGGKTFEIEEGTVR